MTRHLVILTLVGLLTGVGVAQERPAPAEAGDRSESRERGFRRRWDERRWEEAAHFLKEHSPRRWAAFEALPDNQKDRVRVAILRRHIRLERIREHSPDDVYEMVVRRVRHEDEAWRLGQAIRDAADDASRDAHRQALEAVVQAMVQEQFTERERRIERLKKAVATEEMRLAEDRENIDKLVEQQMAKIIATEHPMVDPNAPPSPDAEPGNAEGAAGEPLADRPRRRRQPEPGE